ncbi:hypothetical protein NBZ79_00585 [Sneathiella marina]|uniref:Uncharacterized protein n=1 Tax=Sneathiella marina TaxID=2950108 RepID=A0ABY4W3S2_9PROT|nr:hypothetical protein [Sneathiella marina]USG61471.1 hypothetical protein NBZ79_00585 [Sneathiella marina]
MSLLNTTPTYLLNSYPNQYTPGLLNLSPYVTPPVVQRPLGNGRWNSDPNPADGNEAADSATADVGSMTAAEQMAGISMAHAIGKGLSVAPVGPVGLMPGISKAMLSVALANGMNAEGMNASEAASQQAAQAENEAMGLDAGTAEAASHGLGVGIPGTAAGSGAAGPSGDKVICTELHRQGFMPEHIWRADEEYAKTVDPVVRAGYLLWAVPVVKLMQKSLLATKLVHILAKPWSEHMAYKMHAVEEDNALGRVLIKTGIPLCLILGAISQFRRRTMMDSQKGRKLA